MKRFKEYLLEYLTDKQKQHFAILEMTPKARADTDHFFGKDNDIVHGSLDDSMIDKSEIHKKVEQHLGKELSHHEYRSGITTDKYGRPSKIGRMIKDEKLRNQFAIDPVREGGRNAQSQYTTSTVRGVHVAGQTNSLPDEKHPKGHSWGEISCKNNVTGINRHYLYDEIKHGTVVHFVHDHNGQEIYRATLQPHHNEEGHVAYSVDSQYGIKHPKFTESAHDIAKQLSSKEGTSDLFRIHDKVYNDSGESHILNPHIGSDDLHKILKSKSKQEYFSSDDEDNSYMKKTLALKHPNIDHTHLQTAIDNLGDKPSGKHGNLIATHKMLSNEQLHHMIDNHKRFHIALARNPNLKDEHIEKLLNSKDTSVRAAIMQNPVTDVKHIINGTKDEGGYVRHSAYSNPKLPYEHVVKGLKDEEDYVRKAAVRNQKISGDHLTHALNDVEEVRSAVFSNPNATTEHIERGVRDQSPDVRYFAAKHKNATQDQLHKFASSGDTSLINGVAENRNSNGDHLEIARKHGSQHAKEEIASHPNVSDETLHNLLHDDTDFVRHAAIKSPNIKIEHIRAAAKHPYDYALKTIAKRMLENRE